MPRGDGMGPGGVGAKRGRAAGWCARFTALRYMNWPGVRYTSQFGAGRGRGWRNRYYATGARERIEELERETEKQGNETGN